jgi:hypothetical protein
MKNYLKILIIFILGLSLNSCSQKQNCLQIAEQNVKPNKNFLFASNASLPGRLYMTFIQKDVLMCINTATSFYNKYHTCSNCEDFIKEPERWNFKKVETPQIGDMIIYHNSKTGRAFHAVVLVDIKDGKYYVSHAVRNKYYKNVELKTNSKLAFYRYIDDQV